MHLFQYWVKVAIKVGKKEFKNETPVGIKNSNMPL